MNRYSGIALLIVGLVVLMYGLDSSASFASSVSKFFSGAPTNKSIWLLTLGGFLTLAGLVSVFGGSRLAK